MAEQRKQTIARISEFVYEGFQKYNENFFRITERARRRFEQRDWEGHQQDIIERVELYEKSVRRIVVSLRKNLGASVVDRKLWHNTRRYFGQRLYNVPDAGFLKTFFNSTTRRIFNTVGTDPEIEFVSSAPDEGFNPLETLTLNRYPYWGSLEKTFKNILEDFAFKVPYRNIAAETRTFSQEVQRYYQVHLREHGELVRFEFINSAFFQSARAYLIGRTIQQDHVNPIIIALKNTSSGIEVDAVLLSEEEVSVVFSYTRSYYFANPHSVIGAVHFLHSILPSKPIDELYTVLGRLRQGKTERYRIFSHHLQNTDDNFVHAEGDKGLVMLVFTLPSYDLVFKIIRDNFGYPKTINREEVQSKYRLVSRHDRAGRLIDTQEFRNLEFPVNRFDEALRSELLSEAAETVRVKNDKLIIDHVYIERRVRPLNLYLREANRTDAGEVILDYGQTIKDLANTNIFPGDLLLKNFGVTRHRRVVFYDYDEVALVTECDFREIPDSDDDEDVLRSDVWFHVNKNDIFPEEFIKFLSMDQGLRTLFLEVHGDLLTAEYWNRVKNKLLSGDIELIIPYFRHEIPADQESAVM
ncbi:MAG: bifunctional isocitrate dehydrogenase kinase/phosphatase [Gammaproteobacteria bacterium]|nr:bifunctional isocitrate dehydrogenase kinase/phosphatase [Gammaproteobacteria bacterium]